MILRLKAIPNLGRRLLKVFFASALALVIMELCFYGWFPNKVVDGITELQYGGIFITGLLINYISYKCLQTDWESVLLKFASMGFYYGLFVGIIFVSFLGVKAGFITALYFSVFCLLAFLIIGMFVKFIEYSWSFNFKEWKTELYLRFFKTTKKKGL